MIPDENGEPMKAVFNPHMDRASVPAITLPDRKRSRLTN